MKQRGIDGESTDWMGLSRAISLCASALRHYMLECTFLHNFAQNLLIIAVCDLLFSILNVSKKKYLHSFWQAS